MENHWIDSAAMPLAALWSRWALKEAAYKALKRHYPETLFAWREYETDESLESVHHGARRLTCSVGIDGDRVHGLAVAGAGISDVGLVFPENVGDAGGESAWIRREAIRVLAEALELPAGELEIDEDGRLLLAGRVSRRPLSLSHHGRFGAVAFL